MSGTTPLPILGLHHVTAIASGPYQNDVFWTRVLGMRRVKKTVNFDDPGTYHLYFGDDRGRPGSLWTTFPHPHARPRSAGTPEVALTSLAVPVGSLERWSARLEDAGVAATRTATRFGDRLDFADPDGTTLALTEAEAPSEYEPVGAHRGGAGEPIVADAPRCLESVTLRSSDPPATGRFLVEQFGFTPQDAASDAADSSGVWYACGDGAASRRVCVLAGDASLPILGAGAVHHVAFRVAGDDEQRATIDRLRGVGLRPTPVQDRTYFRSVYFRAPGGILFEVATDGPGFDSDEPVATLGQALKLPPDVEVHRARLEKSLIPLDGQAPEAGTDA
ncbi:MAG: VOC family protein [Planctomycetota bacterium]